MLGGRYEILQLLGQGGMGAVYKARDLELDRLVALKVIRPELAGDPEILKRFKQELILARQVTHKNVVRIFDLGEAEGFKFITMEYVEGRDLKSILAERPKLEPEEAVTIVEQVCRALDAAHTEGVVHRDLKPQNVMLDNEGKVLVMDFGIARSMETPGLTRSGALVGTPEYMSPEQAKGEEVDERSDLFTLGIIFYQLLTGKIPFQADTMFATLLKRTQERAIPPVKEDPRVPRFLSDVVLKCLETERQHRYQKASEVLEDLEAHRRPRGTSLLLRLPRFRTVEDFRTRWVAPALAAVLLLMLGILFRGRIFVPRAKPKPAGPTIALAILPFRNASGDPSLDWLGPSLAEMLSTDVGQSASLRTISPDRVHQVLHDLRLTPDSSLDPNTLQRLAKFSNAQTVVWGSYAKFGDEIRIDAKLQDLARDRTGALKVEAPNARGIPEAVDRLAQAIRENLALPASAIKELQAHAFKPSSKSTEALRSYSEGLQLERQGKHLEAERKFGASTKEDPEFALAYSKLAQTYAVLGHDNQAELESQKAVDLSQNLPLQEKYRIVAAHARITHDTPKAIEAYEKLAEAAPNDPDVQFALGGIYEISGAYDKAREHFGKVLEGDPKSVEALLGMGRVETRSGNAQGGLEYLTRALNLAIEMGNQEERATILQAIGVGYRRMNKQEEALPNYQESLAIKRRLGDKRGIGASLNEIAQILESEGKTDEAVKSYQEALQIRREIGDKKGEGDTLIDLGGIYHDRSQYDEALKLFTQSLQIQRELGNESNQALCLSNIGSCYFYAGKYQDALTYFQQALQLREKANNPEEMVITVHNLAEAYAKLGQYDDALKQYVRALDLYRSAGDKRGAAVESYSIGTLFEYQGRYGAAVSSEEEALKTFRELGERGFWMMQILSGYAEALAEAGRGEETQKILDEALALARELKNQALVAQIVDCQGDAAFYRGDYKSAGKFYAEAAELALRAKDRDRLLVSKFNVAKVAVKEGRAREAISALKALAQEADSLGLKYLSVECSIYLAEALVNSKDYARAREELDQTVLESEKLRLRVLAAQARCLLATALRLTGDDSGASVHYRRAHELLEEVRKEPGADKVMSRADLSAIYIESARWSQSGKA